MNLNDDFSSKVLMHGSQLVWEGSLKDGARTRRLDGVAGDLDRTTDIVECADKSAFPHHDHTGGEECLILDGVLEDDYGVWPAGSYLRSPPGSGHSPHSDTGCVMLIKANQMDTSDESFVRTNINNLEFIKSKDRNGVAAASLFKNEYETVRAERWEPHANFKCTPEGGAEIFIIEGSALENSDKLEAHSWLRIPVGDAVGITAGPEGTLVWVKTNHLKLQ